MTLIESLLLGIIQGLTEFLPVSSSGHIEIGQAILGTESLKDQEELLLQNAKNNKGKSAPAKADPKKGGKPDPKAKEVEAVHEEEKP